MALTPTQHKKILNTYQSRRIENENERKRRIDEVYENIPEIRNIDNLIADKGLEISKLIVVSPEKREHFMKTLRNDIDTLKTKKTALLASKGYPTDYLDQIYTCSSCKDTGYIEGNKCSCLKKAYIAVAYNESNLINIINTENFDTFSFEFYSKEIDKKYGISPYQNIQSVYKVCKDFTTNFDMLFSNIILYGQSGLGKTFLCNCIAKELLDRSYSVIYLSAFQLFRVFEIYRFNNDEDLVSYEEIEHMYTSDLLIIDDLGSEIINSFTSSELFNLINTRLLNKKSTVISTNFTPPEWSKHYSNRIVSRIVGNYTSLMLIGEDIRIQKYS